MKINRSPAVPAPAPPVAEDMAGPIDPGLGRIVLAVAAHYGRDPAHIAGRVPQDARTVLARRAFYYVANWRGFAFERIGLALGRDCSNVGDGARVFGGMVADGQRGALRALAATRAATMRKWLGAGDPTALSGNTTAVDAESLVAAEFTRRAPPGLGVAHVTLTA